MKNYVFPNKNELKHIPISEFADFIRVNYEGSKTEFLTESIETWIRENYKKNIFPNDLMPSKQLMADLLDVSTGTIQNIYRILETKGLLYSKQSIGTMIAEIGNSSVAVRKSSTKREFAAELIKTLLVKNKFKKNDRLPSVRMISSLIGISINTTGLAMEDLAHQQIVKKVKDKDLHWILQTEDFEINQNVNESLTINVANDIKSYIIKNLRLSDKLPSHDELAKIMKVGKKTVHNALSILINEGILLPKRGRYGTYVAKIPEESKLQPNIETSIFAKSQFTAGYHYEKIQDTIKNLIIEKYPINSKLPSIMEMATIMDVSPNTIRKAFSNLAKEGYLTFTRGRYGGTFVKEIPESPNKKAFEWVAVNPNFNDFDDN